MSYDPRVGDSAYLDMDADDYEDAFDEEYEDVQAQSSRPLFRSDAEDTLFRSGTGTMPRQSDVDDTFFRGETGGVPRQSAADDTLFREGTAAQRKTDVPRTLLRPARAARPSPSRQDTAAMQDTAARNPAYRQTSARDTMHAIPSPAQQPYEPERDSRADARGSRGKRPLALLRSFALFALGLLLRVAALLLAVLVVASAFLTGSARATLISALNLTPLLVPPALLGQFVIETPFGGVLRGDLAIASCLLFVADWICMRSSAAQRHGNEGRY